MSYTKSKKVIHTYKVVVMSGKGHCHVNNSTFTGSSKREERNKAFDRAKEILANREFADIQNTTSFDILIDYTVTEINGGMYSLKEGGIL